MKRKGVLLINLGTPDNCDKRSVYRYLTEFLNDPRVIDLPAIIRWPLVNCIIIPTRLKKTTLAYQKIWRLESPLLANSKRLQHALSTELGNDYQAEISMRYGNPSIPLALEKLAHCEEIIVLPLFPQYASATTGSALEKVFSLLKQQWNIPAIKTYHHFYNHPGFIQSYAQIIQAHLQHKSFDMLLFSYHGLPERHITKSLCKATCDRHHACPSIHFNNAYCYRAQCFETTRLIAESIDLSEQQYSVAFQSRLGHTPWIKPHTDLMLPDLIKRGIRNIAIVCPSFVADCLETVEEVNIRMRAQWQTLGGNEFIFIPCLNDHSYWVKALAEIVKDHIVMPARF
jgi:ferrochelatase